MSPCGIAELVSIGCKNNLSGPFRLCGFNNVSRGMYIDSEYRQSRVLVQIANGPNV